MCVRARRRAASWQCRSDRSTLHPDLRVHVTVRQMLRRRDEPAATIRTCSHMHCRATHTRAARPGASPTSAPSPALWPRTVCTDVQMGRIRGRCCGGRRGSGHGCCVCADARRCLAYLSRRGGRERSCDTRGTAATWKPSRRCQGERVVVTCCVWAAQSRRSAGGPADERGSCLGCTECKSGTSCASCADCAFQLYLHYINARLCTSCGTT